MVSYKIEAKLNNLVVILPSSNRYSDPESIRCFSWIQLRFYFSANKTSRNRSRSQHYAHHFVHFSYYEPGQNRLHYPWKYSSTLVSLIVTTSSSKKLHVSCIHAGHLFFERVCGARYVEVDNAALILFAVRDDL